MTLEELKERLKNGGIVVGEHMDEFRYDKDEGKFCKLSYLDSDLLVSDITYYTDDVFDEVIKRIIPIE